VGIDTQTPFLFARLPETPSDFFGQRGRIKKERRVAFAPPNPCVGDKKGTPLDFT